jgi:hypothetical protein
MDAGVEACVGLGGGVGDELGVGGGMLFFCAVVTHVNPQSKTTVKAATSRQSTGLAVTARKPAARPRPLIFC